MAKDMSGTGRLTIFPLLHDWGTGSRCTLAYTTADGGLTAVLGVIPVEGNEFESGDLYAMAGRHGIIGEWKSSHEQRCACWLACTGAGSRTVRKPGTIDLPAAVWALDMVRTVVPDIAYYGHPWGASGPMTLTDGAVAEEA